MRRKGTDTARGDDSSMPRRENGAKFGAGGGCMVAARALTSSGAPVNTTGGVSFTSTTESESPSETTTTGLKALEVVKPWVFTGVAQPGKIGRFSQSIAIAREGDDRTRASSPACRSSVLSRQTTSFSQLLPATKPPLVVNSAENSTNAADSEAPTPPAFRDEDDGEEAIAFSHASQTQGAKEGFVTRIMAESSDLNDMRRRTVGHAEKSDGKRVAISKPLLLSTICRCSPRA